MTSNNHQGPRAQGLPAQGEHDQGEHDQGMESLSALFDGELHGDAARFAMKRLGHDPQWRQAVGNWQLLGDAMRGQARRVAPNDFAARVAAAVSTEAARTAAIVAPTATADASPAASARRRRWIGGAALAASVAMVAMFVARPFSSDQGAAPGAAMPAAIELATAPASMPTPVQALPAPSEPSLQARAASLAVAGQARRVSERRSRGQSKRVALHASKRQLAVPAIASAAPASALAMADSAVHASPNPFRPPHVEVVSRPWPRAVLPASSSGAFTAGYGTGMASSPSFYPFEPRLPSANDAASGPVEAQERRR